MPHPTPKEVFLRLVAGVSERRFDDLPGLYAPHTDVRHPMSPAPPMTTRADLDRHFQGAAKAMGPLAFRPENIVVHETLDPEVIVAEFEYRGTIGATGETFAVACVFVMRVRDGEIVESRDYVDHQAFARARAKAG